jgi:hypothetical protein
MSCIRQPRTSKISPAFQYPIDLVFRFMRGIGKLPLVFTPLKDNGTATQPGAQPAAVPSSCNSVITPACLQALYGIPTTLATQSSNKLAVAGYLEQYAQIADLQVRQHSIHSLVPHHNITNIEFPHCVAS